MSFIIVLSLGKGGSNEQMFGAGAEFDARGRSIRGI
jgi:hypothetical protein